MHVSCADQVGGWVRGLSFPDPQLQTLYQEEYIIDLHLLEKHTDNFNK